MIWVLQLQLQPSVRASEWPEQARKMRAKRPKRALANACSRECHYTAACSPPRADAGKRRRDQLASARLAAPLTYGRAKAQSPPILSVANVKAFSASSSIETPRPTLEGTSIVLSELSMKRSHVMSR